MLTFHHCPQTRSSSVRWLLEELGVDYTVERVDLRAEGGVPDTYRAVQPHKKVPAIVHDGVTVTERSAITIYLCDAFPQARLAPAIGDPRRGPYLSWLAYSDAVMDPNIAARFNKWQYDPRTVSFGTFEDMLAHVERTLAAHEYVTGNTFTAADVQVGSLLNWTVRVFKLVPESPAIGAYLDRLQAREAFQRAQALDAA